MTTQPTTRPSRPTRPIPPVPEELLAALNLDGATPAPILTDHILAPPSPGSAEFHTPLSASPTSELPPPPPPPKGTQDGHEQETPPDSSELTPLRAHYLKKQLVQLQFHRELNAITSIPRNNISPFSYLGPPFSTPPKDGPRLDLPFLRYMFRHFVVTFPFLHAAPKGFFSDKLQPFMGSLMSRNFSDAAPFDNNPDNSEEAARFKLLKKLEKNFSMLITSGTKLVEQEDVVRLTQRDLDRLEALSKKRAARERKLKDLFEVNVVCVRNVVERKRVRSKAHDEFIIRTRRRQQPDVFVSRRYGDFRTLADELRKAHPSEVVPPPPAKDRTYVNVNLSASSSTSASASGSPPSPYGYPTTPLSASQSGSGTPYVPRQSRPMPGMYQNDMLRGSMDSLQSNFSQGSGSPTSPIYGGFDSPTANSSRLSREKNRLTLRAYLHSLLRSTVFASSPVLRSFLLSGPTQLSDAELEDARRREEADRMREDGRIRFAKEIRDRVDSLRDAVRSVKGELLGKDGLTRVFATIKETSDVNALPSNYQAVIEWARISLASTVFQHFVAADNASERFAGLKRVHGLMPYFMLKAALKITNPVGMIRGVLDLFLAQPFGGRSLLQRMFTGSLMEEVKALEEDIEAIKQKVEDPLLCEKVRLYVNAPLEIQSIYKLDATSEDMHVLTVVLRSGEEPRLNRAQLFRVQRASRAHKLYLDAHPDSDDDEGPEDEDAWLYEDLILLSKLYARLRDREQLIALIFEGNTSDLLKDIITIFYSPLAQVYRAASIADSLGDLQSFINDLIRTVEQSEELSQQDPARTVQIFINLIQRHEQAFYSFVHKVHSKGEGLFDSLMQWIERFLTLMREGLGEPISLEFLLPHTGQERQDIMQEVDAVARYHYLLKVAYEDKVRRRFGRSQGQSEADAEDEAAAEMVNGIVSDLSFGDLVKGDADELAAEADDDEEDSDSDSESDDEEDSDEDDDSEEETDSDSEQSESGSSTDGGTTRGTTPTPSIVQRSYTVHSPHSPQSTSQSPRQSPRQLPYQRIPKHSLDMPPSSRPPPPPHLRSSRSMSLAEVGSASSSKSLPQLPHSARVPERGQGKPVPPAKSSKKKKPEGPKPPELHHLPKLLPLFVEMVRTFTLRDRMS
ncbi:hypothetical protein BDY19DRAFT_924281 [Irpex rosettiformis]|uniref:Uncharacterized protein n=1 Tax=Irpex rosettiformis TaxID=378272 RepID=A0ACB8UEI1_9APHY|nr:hypothetical protein BDY19DRAFT_924281 [Irpex rosettiformis]